MPGNQIKIAIAHAMLVSLLMWTGLATSCFAQVGDSAQKASRRPNIILVNLDDCDVDLVSKSQLQHYPNLQELAGNSIRFTNCHVTTPLCGPSRACLFRGQYAHNTGYRTNRANLDVGSGFVGGTQFFQQSGLAADQLPVWMENSGYHTMLVGKYYQGATDYVPVPGWSRFWPWGGNRYIDAYRFKFGTDGKLDRGKVVGYRTELETDDVVELLGEYDSDIGPDKPFFLYLAPVAPHVGAKGENPILDKWKDRFLDFELPDMLAFNEADVSDKPSSYRDTLPLTRSAIVKIKSDQRRRLIAMLGVDEMMLRIQTKLKEINQSENTIIMLTSDHGYLMGQHRQIGKSLPLDQATRVPLWVSWPGRIKPQDARNANHLLAHIDITATVADLAGAKVPDFVDGRSFKKLIDDPSIEDLTAVREAVVIQNWESRLNSAVNQKMVYSSIRKVDSQYTEWATGEREFYDLKTDPHQLDNSYVELDSAEKSSLSAELHSARQRSSSQSGTVSTISFPTVNRKFIGPDIELQGYAESGQLVGEIFVSLKRKRDGKFWDGAQWSEDRSLIPTTVPNQPGVLSQWWLRPDISRGLETGESITIQVHADQKAENGYSIDQLDVVFDDKPPEVEVLRPWNNHAYPAFSKFGGTIKDEYGVADAELFVQNLETKEYFDGVGWRKEKVSAPLFVNIKTGLWHGNYPLPKGRFEATVVGKDAAGNWSELSPPHRCIVDPSLKEIVKLEAPIE
jgi:arylsulfatase A-like enzyme